MTRDPNRPGAEDGFTSSFGSGEPVTLFVHGFAGSIRDTRPFGMGVDGTRSFVHLGGHGGRPSPGEDWTYSDIASQIARALRDTRASRALGVSMGAGGLARLITERALPATDLQKVAFVLPASWGSFDPAHLSHAADFTRTARRLLAAGDRAGLIDEFIARESPEVREIPAVRDFARSRVDELVETDLSDGLALSQQIAVDHPEAAADFPGEVLILTHEDDPVHPVRIAEAYHRAFPGSRLEVLPPGSILWKGRSRIREILTDFFNG